MLNPLPPRRARDSLRKQADQDPSKSGRLRKASKLAKTKSQMKKAARLNLDDPFRRGAVIFLPDEGDALFSGDLHGAKDNLTRLIEIADLEAHPQRHLLLQEVVHNIQFGLIDRDISFRVLERVAQLKIDFPDRVHVIMGNHELSELTGKKITKENHPLNLMFAQGIKSTYGEAAYEIKISYNQFFKSMPLAARTKHGIFFSHSTPALRHTEGFDPRVFKLEGEVTEKRMNAYIERLVWGREFTQEAADAFAKLVEAEVLIVGHEACSKGFKVPNTRHVILDSKDEAACYLTVPLDRLVTHQEVVRSIRRLYPE